MEDQDRPRAASDPLLEAPAYLLFELMRLIRRTAAERFPGERVRLPHLLVLACVSAEGPLSQREVSERLRMDPGDLVGLIDVLEESGYVARRRDPGDRRRHAVGATGAGRRRLGEIRERRARLDEELFAPLAPRELEQFTEMLLRVLAGHDDRFAPAARRPGQPTG